MRALALVVGALVASSSPALAQAPPSRSIQIGGYAMVGQFTFTAVKSFEAVLGKSSSPIFGGGATVGLPIGGLYVDLGAWRFTDEGERVLVLNNEVFPLGIPLTVTIIPVEITAGWKFRFANSNFVPFVGGGFTSYGYKETSTFAASGENTDDRFTGYHLTGGVEYKVMRWLGVGGEFTWTRIPNAIGSAGVAKVFDETDLGGTSIRARLTVGR
jgi:hypothetical protein